MKIGKLALPLAVATVTNAYAVTLYEDPETHQVFTKEAPGLVKLEDTPVQSKAVMLKFNGVHYVGFVSAKEDGGDRTSRFETRRNYLQVKAYLNKHDFFRLTLDSFQETKGDNKDKGSWLTRVKYAYLYLDEILPYTGIEFGQVHRPWIDYEEQHGWLYRPISNVWIEDGSGAHLINSADMGINFKTKVPYFSSEIGLFNGEGYHAIENGEGLSAEARLTLHALGTGAKKVKVNKHQYFDISYFGVKSLEDNKRGNSDFMMNGIHAVYNAPAFLIAGQYVTADNGDNNVYDGNGYSLNAEIRPFEKLWWFGRYDDWDQNDTMSNNGGDRRQYILGGMYHYNKNVKFIANITSVDFDEDDALNAAEKDSIDLMFTAEVKW